MATIATSAEHRRKFNQLFAEWQREYGATIQGGVATSVEIGLRRFPAV